MTDRIALQESEIRFDFVRAGGPGGQHVNKVSTAAQLRFDARNSPSLPEEVRHRLSIVAGRRMTSKGVLIIEARASRSQEQNREEALQKLIELIRRAAQRPRRRRKTRPTAASRERRIQQKKERGEKKRCRLRPPLDQ